MIALIPFDIGCERISFFFALGMRGGRFCSLLDLPFGKFVPIRMLKKEIMQLGCSIGDAPSQVWGAACSITPRP
ncbi:MAG: hypothetical protein M3R08_02605 [Bacteroidota bacterium]|nr:hypothetical protein [Bacteroidota bacterium]